MEKIIKFLHQHWFIILVTLIAACLRLYRIESSLMFLGDQGRDAVIIKRMLIDHDLPFIGPITSVGGFYLGPLYYYFMAPFLWLANFNPAGPAIATAVLGIATVPLIYLLTKKLFSVAAANWASLLYAIAYIPISETRSAWNPNPMPLTVLGIIYGFYLASYQRQPKGLILAFFSLAVALQLHYMIVFLAPWLIWQIIVFFRQPKTRQVFVPALGLFLLLMFPLILFEIKNHGLNTQGLFEFLTKNQYNQLNLWQTLKDTNGRSQQAIGMILGFGRDFNLIRTWITRIILLLIIIFCFKKPRPEFKLISFWLLSSIITISFYQSNIYPHYLGFIFPAVFILSGYFLSKLKRYWLIISLAWLLLFSYFNLPQISHLLKNQGNLKTIKLTTDFIYQDIQANQHHQVNLALIDDTRDYRAMNYRYFLELTDADLLNYDQHPDSQILYVISPYQQPEIAANPLWEIQSLQAPQLIQSWYLPGQGYIYKLAKL